VIVKAFKGVVDKDLLPSRELPWTIHGPCRSLAPMGPLGIRRPRWWSVDTPTV